MTRRKTQHVEGAPAQASPQAPAPAETAPPEAQTSSSPPGPQAPDLLPPTMENMIQIINTQTQQIEVLKKDFKQVVDAFTQMTTQLKAAKGINEAQQVASMGQGPGDLKRQIATNAQQMPGSLMPGAQTGAQPGPSLPPQLLRLIETVGPSIGKAVDRYINGGSSNSSNTAGDLLMKKLAEYQTKKMGDMVDRIIRAVEADERGQLYIGTPPVVAPNKSAEVPK